MPHFVKLLADENLVSWGWKLVRESFRNSAPESLDEMRMLERFAAVKLGIFSLHELTGEQKIRTEAEALRMVIAWRTQTTEVVFMNYLSMLFDVVDNYKSVSGEVFSSANQLEQLFKFMHGLQPDAKRSKMFNTLLRITLENNRYLGLYLDAAVIEYSLRLKPEDLLVAQPLPSAPAVTSDEVVVEHLGALFERSNIYTPAAAAALPSASTSAALSAAESERLANDFMAWFEEQIAAAANQPPSQQPSSAARKSDTNYNPWKS